MKHILGILTFAFVLGANGTFVLDANAASAIDPDVAMIGIGLESEQETQFKVMMRRLNRDIGDVITKERTRNFGTMSARQIESRIKRKIKRLYRDLDELAKEILRENQWDAYLTFKDAHHAVTNKQEFVPPGDRRY